MTFPVLDPIDIADTLDYTVSFARWLGTDTISTVSITSSGVTVDSYSHANGVVTVWIKNGVEGQRAAVRVKITSAAGRVKTQSFNVEVRPT